MRQDDYTQVRYAASFSGGFREPLESLCHHSHGRNPVLFQFGAVVDTPRCAGPSVAHAANDGVRPVHQLIHVSG